MQLIRELDTHAHALEGSRKGGRGGGGGLGAKVTILNARRNGPGSVYTVARNEVSSERGKWVALSIRSERLFTRCFVATSPPLSV